MADFQFLKNPIFQKWIVLAPHRANRPDVAKGAEPVCPFCPGKEAESPELYRIGGTAGDSSWQVRVTSNKYPFAPIHELVIHSPDHQKSFTELPVEHTKLVFQTYRERYNTHAKSGQVYIFHNRGVPAGESLPHAHSQIAVIPEEIKMDIPRLDPFASFGYGPKPQTIESANQEIMIEDMVETKHFYMFCPRTSQWPDEIWVAPKKRGRAYGEITDEELDDFAMVVNRLIYIFTVRHGHDFPFNYYIYPGGDWYLRIIPRLKTLGGFELGTGIFVNTQPPEETMAFIKTHFENPNEEKIQTEHLADYHTGV
jgi:UDPglucose--hexose-1-phosphate uridylyltransferase